MLLVVRGLSAPRIVLVRMKLHPPTGAYVARRTAEGPCKRELMLWLKRKAAKYTVTSSPSSPLILEPTVHSTALR